MRLVPFFPRLLEGERLPSLSLDLEDGSTPGLPLGE